MKRGMRVALGIVAVVLASCASMYGVVRYSRDLPKTLSNGTFTFVIDRAQTDLNHKDYYFFGTVANVSGSEAIFDSADLEAKDEASGVSYFSISKDKQSVSLPVHMQHVILRKTLKPGQKVSGALWFATNVGEAKAQKLKLIYGNGSVVLEP